MVASSLDESPKRRNLSVADVPKRFANDGNPTDARSFGAMSLFPMFSPLRVGSAPFPLFPRIILPPVLSRAYSAPSTFFNLIHKTKTSERLDQTVIKAVQSTSDS